MSLETLPRSEVLRPRRHSTLPPAALAFMLMVHSLWALTPRSEEGAAPQSDQDALFNQAVQAYNQNQFTPALEQFQKISGLHTQEAQAYSGKIKAYKEAMMAAKSIVDRSADERDGRSLAFAMEEVEEAMKIKRDGPWQPSELLEKARTLKAEVEKTHAETSKNADRGFCDRALAAATQHHFKEARLFSCLLADNDAAYSCGGDEAVHMCESNTELAKLDKGATAQVESGPSPHTASLDRARAAYDSNDFERARNLLQGVNGDSRPAAEELLQKISRYSESLATGEKLSREGKYEEAQAAFLSAAGIKPDGPGNPQPRAARMELFLALDQFYSGDYTSSTRHLESCARTSTGKPPVVHFYLGASELARFFLTGREDSALHQEALNNLKLAKQSGFKLSGQEISPKIRQVYEDLSF